MSDINQVFLSGRLGQDPKMKYFGSLAKNVNISIGVNRWSQKEEKENIAWFNCVAWGSKAEFIGEYIKKGDLVFVTGSLQKDVWEDEQGNKKSNTYILIEKIKTQSKKQ